MTRDRIIIAAALIYTAACALAFAYCLFKLATEPSHNYPDLDTWEHHADRPEPNKPQVGAPEGITK